MVVCHDIFIFDFRILPDISVFVFSNRKNIFENAAVERGDLRFFRDDRTETLDARSRVYFRLFRGNAQFFDGEAAEFRPQISKVELFFAQRRCDSDFPDFRGNRFQNSQASSFRHSAAGDCFVVDVSRPSQSAPARILGFLGKYSGLMWLNHSFILHYYLRQELYRIPSVLGVFLATTLLSLLVAMVMRRLIFAFPWDALLGKIPAFSDIRKLTDSRAVKNFKERVLKRGKKL